MKKIILILGIYNLISFSFVYDFLNNGFSAKVKEISNINQNKKEKSYNLEYQKDKLELEVTFPELNKGEKYTYTKNEKILYIPKLKQTTKQSINNQEESIYAILNDLKNIKESKDFNKNSKKYIFENGLLKKIIAKDYQISILKHENNKPTEILFLSSNVEVYYNIKY